MEEKKRFGQHGRNVPKNVKDLKISSVPSLKRKENNNTLTKER